MYLCNFMVHNDYLYIVKPHTPNLPLTFCIAKRDKNSGFFVLFPDNIYLPFGTAGFSASTIPFVMLLFKSPIFGWRLAPFPNKPGSKMLYDGGCYFISGQRKRSFVSQSSCGEYKNSWNITGRGRSYRVLVFFLAESDR